MTPGPGSEEAVRRAATVVLLRESPDGPEVLLTIRQKNLRFMPGAAVFPGGAVDVGDSDPRWQGFSDLDGATAARALGIDDESEALTYYVAAIRETYEEVGLLVADTDGAVDRGAARDGASFLDACAESGTRLSASRLHPAGRWVTPMGAPIRFDAQFFVAVAPSGFEADPDPSEVAGSRWITPDDALSGLGAGDFLMAPPTIEMLHRLKGHSSTESILESMHAPEHSHEGIISTRLSPNVHVVIAPNAGLMTGPGTNTYVVGSGPVCVIDPAVDDEAYMKALRAAAPDVAAIVITHRHSDHTGGAHALSSATGAPIRAWGTSTIDGVAVQPLDDGEIIEIPGAKLTTLFAPGHASDHICLHEAATATLFAGDNILGEGTAVIAPPDGNMRDYLTSLRRLLELHIDRIYPGHFRALNGGRAVIEHYIAHRAERERSVLDALARGPRSIDQLVSDIYVDTPPALHGIARYSVLAHLEMLNEDGRVVANGDFWSLVDV